MHKLKSLSFSFVLVMLFSCSSSTKEYIIQTHDNGKPKLIECYQINQKDSVKVKEIQYYTGGHKRIEGTFLNDKKDGAWTFWFEDGTVWSEGFFTEGIRSGKTLVYQDNGNLFYEGSYADGKKDGIWIFYNKEGEKINKISFDNGKMISQEPLNKENK